MKLQRTTLILLVTAILLGGFVYYSEIQGAQKREAAKTTKRPIFSFKEDQIQSLTIYMGEETLEFERVSGKETAWQMKTPNDVPASDASIAFLSNLLVEGKSDRSFPIKANQLQEYGLDKPTAVVKVQLKNQQTHQLILGKPDFNRSFLYAQVDPSSQKPQPLNVFLVPIDFEYAVNRPMSEWQLKSENSAGAKKPSPTPNSSKPSPIPSSSSPSPTPESSKPSPTPESSKPSPHQRVLNPHPRQRVLNPHPRQRVLNPHPRQRVLAPHQHQRVLNPHLTPESSKPSPASGR
jgi:hypothetical protein